MVWIGYDVSGPALNAGVLFVGRHGSCDNVPVGWLTTPMDPSTWNSQTEILAADPGQNGWVFDSENLLLSANFTLTQLLACTATDPPTWDIETGIGFQRYTTHIIVADVLVQSMLNNTGGMLFPGDYFMVEQYRWSLRVNTTATIMALMSGVIFDAEPLSASVVPGPEPGWAQIYLCTVTSQDIDPLSHVALMLAADVTIGGGLYNATATGTSLATMIPITLSNENSALIYTCNTSIVGYVNPCGQCWEYTSIGPVDYTALAIALSGSTPITFEFFKIVEDGIEGTWGNSVFVTPDEVTTPFVYNTTAEFACYYDLAHTLPIAMGGSIAVNCPIYCVVPEGVTSVVGCVSDCYDELFDVCDTGPIVSWATTECGLMDPLGSVCIRIYAHHVGLKTFRLAETQLVTYGIIGSIANYVQQVAVHCPMHGLVGTLTDGTDACLVSGFRLLASRTASLGAILFLLVIAILPFVMCRRKHVL